MGGCHILYHRCGWRVRDREIGMDALFRPNVGLRDHSYGPHCVVGVSDKRLWTLRAWIWPAQIGMNVHKYGHDKIVVAFSLSLNISTT